jgi:HPt (histidine-containing phosphotransfer) domain-containing protein
MTRWIPRRYRPIIALAAVLVLVVGALAAYNLWQRQRLLANDAVSLALARARVAIDRLTDAIPLDALLTRIDAELGPLAAGRAASPDGRGWYDVDNSDPETARELAEADHEWRDYRGRVEADSGSASSAASAQLPALKHALDALATRMATRERDDATRFLVLQVLGLTSALLILGGLVVHVVRDLRREDAAQARTRAETERILDTVGEGLLLLDRNNRIGAQTSRALKRMLGREEVAGLPFEEILADLLPEKICRTALEFVALLWGERVNENLVRSLNPLAEVEVRVPTATGGTELRTFAFDFSRVRIGSRTTQILCTIGDVSHRVQLSREVSAGETQQQGLLDMLMSILKVPTEQLAAFFADTEAAMLLVNSILKLPSREESAFREKLERIFREIHALKAEAAALGLKSVELRAHRFEDALAELRGRPSLTGNDFLPLAVKLDDLFGHLGAMRELVGRSSQLRAALAEMPPLHATPAADPSTAETAPGGTVKLRLDPSVFAAPPPVSLAGSLQRLAEQIAAKHAREVSLVCVGLERVPAAYARPTRDILNQLVRNAVIHGIETPEERARAQKARLGTLAVEFVDHGDGGFELTFQDDGRGLDHERIRTTAVARGLISADAAAATDPRKLASYIFKAGFSTAANVSTDAGRGVGMNLVREIVVELGGRISLSTRAGQFTRFRIHLPALQTAVA